MNATFKKARETVRNLLSMREADVKRRLPVTTLPLLLALFVRGLGLSARIL
jgi:hypothetical protein